MKDHSHDQLADVMGEAIREAHRRVDTHHNPQLRKEINKHLKAAHAHLEKARNAAAGGGVIQPFSGGDPKPTGG